MEIAPKRKLQLSGAADYWRIWNLGDLHLGTKACDEEMIRRVVVAIRDDPKSLWIGNGDYIEAISRHDLKRFDAGALATWITGEEIEYIVDVQRDRIIDMLAPIAGKCLGLVRGNHEESALKWYGHEVTRDIAKALKVCYLKVSGCVPLQLVRGKRSTALMRLMVTHGHSAGITAGGAANMLERAANRFDAHVVCLGHLHRRMSVEVDRIGVNDAATNLKSFRTVALMSGGFFKTYQKGVSTYGEKRMYPASALGPLAVDVTMDRKFHGSAESIEVRARVLEPVY